MKRIDFETYEANPDKFDVLSVKKVDGVYVYEVIEL